MNQEWGQWGRWVLSQMSIRSLHPVKQSQLLPQHSHNPFSNHFFWKLLFFTGHLAMFSFFCQTKKRTYGANTPVWNFQLPTVWKEWSYHTCYMFVFTSIGLLNSVIWKNLTRLWLVFCNILNIAKQHESTWILLTLKNDSWSPCSSNSSKIKCVCLQLPVSGDPGW